MRTDGWNEQGRKDNSRISKLFEDIIDRGAGADEDLEADERSEELGDAVLAEVVALNEAGKWREAHERFDVANVPFVKHMEETPLGLGNVIVLGKDSFLVRRGRSEDEAGPVVHIDGDRIETLDGVVGFAISRNRAWVALATTAGISVSQGFGTGSVQTIPWPKKNAIRPSTFDISNDGRTVVIVSDHGGWLAREGKWTPLVPREGVGDDEMASYIHAALSPDGRYVAYGWVDSPGHYVDDISSGKFEHVGMIGTIHEAPYSVLFTDDSRHILSNTREDLQGTTVYLPVEHIRGIEEFEDVPESAARTDEYLRAFGWCLLPGPLVGQAETVAWIGGSGWSHGAPLSGGKPAFTHLLNSPLDGMDFDPVSERVAIASESGVLHVLAPGQPAAPGRARGYKPRKELYRWIFWDTLDAPIRW